MGVFDRNLKQDLKTKLLERGLWVKRTTDPRRLRALLASLRPVATEHALIRVGGEGDGGYLIPDDLEGVTSCFSPGVSSVADFELGLVERNIACFLADASVQGPPVAHPLFDFEKKFLGGRTHGEVISLQDWVDAKRPGERDMILQMDIEGAEYEVLLAASDELLSRFRILTIEFHHLETLYDAAAFAFLKLTFDKLTHQFDVVHIHPNNNLPCVRSGPFLVPPLIEATFLQRDRSRRRTPRTDFPHPLDRTNSSVCPDVPLPACWWREEH